MGEGLEGDWGWVERRGVRFWGRLEGGLGSRFGREWVKGGGGYGSGNGVVLGKVVRVGYGLDGGMKGNGLVLGLGEEGGFGLRGVEV
ncbi:uncharacterized protein G2W53_044585 [Senna tora]|uniref:Uncharacterized protein n=1 Tax=Senna tora TaxID=362788 RepID=A0A834SBX1_9FABA|nr:uncharacterized protein G2W53_044585 [Senna tora]